jgi:uncharacterized membrane protein YphA (DoxX/SURF4 family)
MNNLTRFFLILLRIAIGWHFLFEGIDKIESIRRGPTETSRPFSSAAYLYESSGPLNSVVKEQVGDPDYAAIERLTPFETLNESKPPLAGKRYLAPIVIEEWDEYFNRAAQYYGIPRDSEQMKKAEEALEKAKDKAGLWLLQGGKDVDKSFSSVVYKAPMTTKERVDEYRRKLAQVHDVVEHELPAFDKDVKKNNLQAAKAEVVRLRNELLADLKQPLDEAIRGVLSDEQKRMPPMSADYGKALTELSRIEWIDRIVSWGLIVVGGCLLLGLFTRTSAVAGALFLLMLYLAMPPFPGVPEVTRTEGKYFFVNKNLVEMLALLVLATTRSGQWIGLDGLIVSLNPFRRRYV